MLFYYMDNLYKIKNTLYLNPSKEYEDKNLYPPVYSREIMVHPVDHINETLDHVDDNIQTIGLASSGSRL